MKRVEWLPKHLIRQCGVALIGSLMISLGTNLFLIPEHLIDGGMVGVGLLLQYYYGWLPGRTILLLSVPVFGFAFVSDRALFYYSLLGLVLSSLSIDLLSSLRGVLHLPLPLHAIYGGALIGAGIGVMLARGMSTGGTDLIAQMIAGRTGIPPALLIFTIDFAILLFGLYVLGLERTLFSMITIAFGAAFTHIFVSAKRPRR